MKIISFYQERQHLHDINQKCKEEVKIGIFFYWLKWLRITLMLFFFLVRLITLDIVNVLSAICHYPGDMTVNDQNLPNPFKELRLKHGYKSMYQLSRKAKEMNITLSTALLSYIEDGVRTPSFSTLCKLKKIYNCDGDLFFRD